MRASTFALFALSGALLAYVIARQVAPQKFDELGAAVSSGYDNLTAYLEGYRGEPYQDQAGLWTIGIGHLIRPGDGFWSPDNPHGVKTISVPDARALYEADHAEAAAAVDRFVNVPLSDSQRTALISLAYNIGAGAFGNSTLVRMLNAGDYAAAADQFLVWNKYRDPETKQLVVSSGLTARREKEREVFLA